MIGPGSTGGLGGGGGGGAGPNITGTWRNVMSFTTSGGETIVSDTRWTFGTGGACSRTVLRTFVNAGVQETETRACTYVVGASTVEVIYEGSSVPVRFSIAFAGADLLLGGFRFTRIG